MVATDQLYLWVIESLPIGVVVWCKTFVVAWICSHLTLSFSSDLGYLIKKSSHLRSSQERHSLEALRSYSLGKACPIPAVLAICLEHGLPSCFTHTSNKCSNINSNSHSHRESGQSTSCQTMKQTLQKFTPSYQEILDKHDCVSASKDARRPHVEGNFAFHTLWALLIEAAF